MKIACMEFRRELWQRWDAGRPAPKGHACASCGAYAGRAARLNGALPTAFEPALPVGLEAVVMERLALEPAAAEASWRPILVGIAASAGLAGAAAVYLGLSWPDLSIVDPREFASGARSVWGSLLAPAAAVPTAPVLLLLAVSSFLCVSWTRGAAREDAGRQSW